jgi:hypothetical protein
MLLGKVKTEHDALTNLYKTDKHDKVKYDHDKQYSHTFEMNDKDQQPLTSPLELPSVVLLGTFFLPPAENEVKKEKDTTGKRKCTGLDEENVEDGSNNKHCCLVDDQVEIEEIDTITFPIYCYLCIDNKSLLLLCCIQ